MKKIYPIMILLIFSIVMLVGCFSNKNFGDRQGMESDRGFNLTEEERQQMSEERQQKAIESCQGKSEDDICQFESPMGSIDGTCKIMDENLVCTTDRTVRQRQR